MHQHILYTTMQTEPLHQQLSSPSFSSYSSDHIAARVIHEIRTHDSLSASPQQNDNLTLTPKPNDDNDFEFAFLSTHPISSPVSADDIFHNGQITPTTYPLFDRAFLNGVVSVPPVHPANAEAAPRRRRLPLKKLMAEDGKELDGVAAGTYCVWTPPCKKSGSTGSSSKRWKLRDLLLRSHSYGKKESILFLGAGGKHSSGDIGGAGAAKDGYRSKRKLGIGWVVQ